MAKIKKILLLDKEFEKLTDEEYEKYRDDYAKYCVETHEFVEDLNGIKNRAARDAIFANLLSPFQYFLEDQLRNKRLDNGKLANPWDRPYPKR